MEMYVADSMLKKLVKDRIRSTESQTVFVQRFVCISSIHPCLTVQEKHTVLKKSDIIRYRLNYLVMSTSRYSLKSMIYFTQSRILLFPCVLQSNQFTVEETFDKF